MTRKRLFLDRYTIFTNFHPTYSNVVSVQVLFCFFKVSEPIEIYLLEGTVITKNMELFHGFHFFTVVRFVGDIDDFFKTKGACTTNDSSDVIFLADIVQEQEAFWYLFLHLDKQISTFNLWFHAALTALDLILIYDSQIN